MFLSEKNNPQNNAQAKMLRIKRFPMAHVLCHIRNRGSCTQTENTDLTPEEGLSGILTHFISVGSRYYFDSIVGLAT